MGLVIAVSPERIHGKPVRQGACSGLTDRVLEMPRCRLALGINPAEKKLRRTGFQPVRSRLEKPS
jgi:hypothetical protein